MAHLLLLTVVVAVMAALLPGASPRAELLFADDFGTGDFSRHNAHFRWGRSGRIEPGDGSRIVEVTGPHGTAVNAIRFAYGTWQEVRFHLTAQLEEERTERGPSSVAHQELWVSFWMRVPENYFHRHARPGNNKGWLYLWKDGYEEWSSSAPQSELTPVTMSLHWWAAGRDPADAGYGKSTVSLVNSRGRDQRGHRNTPTFVRHQERIPGSTRAYAFLPSEYGRWVHYTFGMRAASAPGSADGFTRIYKNGALAIAWEGLDGGADDPARNGFDRGYLMGYHNSGYDERTVFYITDFRIGTTRDAVFPAARSDAEQSDYRVTGR